MIMVLIRDLFPKETHCSIYRQHDRVGVCFTTRQGQRAMDEMRRPGKG